MVPAPCYDLIDSGQCFPQVEADEEVVDASFPGWASQDEDQRLRDVRETRCCR